MDIECYRSGLWKVQVPAFYVRPLLLSLKPCSYEEVFVCAVDKSPKILIAGCCSLADESREH